jgi:outer membrane protein, heavy metal efflux system
LSLRFGNRIGEWFAARIVRAKPATRKEDDMRTRLYIRLAALLLALPAAGAQAQQPAAAAPPVKLDDLVAEVQRINPAVLAYQRQVEAQRARIGPAKTLPDPIVSVGWMGNIAPFDVQHGDPSSYRGVTAMEEFPYPGKLKLRGEIAAQETEAARWDYEAARRHVVAEMKAAFYDYSYAYHAIEITRKNKELLEKLSRIAQARYEVGKGIQQDVLKSQVELSRLLQRLTVLEQEEKTARARINTLLNRDPETPLGAPAPFTQAKLTRSLASLYQLARSNDPGLERQQRLIERSQYALRLAQKDSYPDFRVGYMYQQRPDMPDMHGITVGINIPIFYKTRQREEVRSATEELSSAQQMRENRQTTVFFEIKQDYLAAKSSADLAELYSRAVVPQSSLALESALAAYQVGKADFLTVFDNFVTVLDYETNYYHELANYQTALARLEPLVGVELTQ